MSPAVTVRAKSQIKTLPDGEYVTVFATYLRPAHPHGSIGKLGTFDTEVGQFIKLDDGNCMILEHEEYQAAGATEPKKGDRVGIRAVVKVEDDWMDPVGQKKYRRLYAKRITVMRG